VAIIVVGKSLAALAIVRAFGRPFDVGLTIATSLAQIGEFAFILAGLGVSLGLLDKEGRDLIPAGALVSICINPLLFNALDVWLERREHDAQAHAAEVEDLPAGPPIPLREHIILVGFGHVGSLVGRRLHEGGHALALIEAERDRLHEAHALGIAGILGNAAAEDVLEAAHAAQARAILIAMTPALEAGNIVRHARALNPAIAVLAHAHSDEEMAYLLKCGADAAVMGDREIARSLCDSVEGLAYYFRKTAAAEQASQAA
ncbi:MAG: NAD-binding protein, partial [Rhodanobacter sp.]|jgi:CPA2 family monovalent cation:H+ antiporter-2|nr:NAD-binding protein [Rhodanobacter sp.]